MQRWRACSSRDFISVILGTIMYSVYYVTPTYDWSDMVMKFSRDSSTLTVDEVYKIYFRSFYMIFHRAQVCILFEVNYNGRFIKIILSEKLEKKNWKIKLIFYDCSFKVEGCLISIEILSTS